MELFYIFKYKFLILKHRFQNLSIIDKLTLYITLLLIFPIIFVANILVLRMFKLDFHTYSFFLNLAIILLMVVLFPSLIKSAYSNNFEIEKDYILYTSPITLDTIFFYKFIITTSKFLFPYILIIIPNIISFGIINNYSFVYFILSIVSLILFLVILSSIIQILIIVSTSIITYRYRKIFINVISSIISLSIIIMFIYYCKIENISNLVKLFYNNDIFNKIFFLFSLWNNILLGLFKFKIELFSLIILSAAAILTIIIFLYLFKKLYLNGCFISNNTNNVVNISGRSTIVYNILRIVFSENYSLIYKDLLIFSRSIDKWGLILMPIIFVPLPFLGRANLYDFNTIEKVLILSFLWISLNISFDSIKSEGSMLKIIKNSTFNLENVIYAKLIFASILSIIVYIVISLALLILVKLSILKLVTLSISVISLIFITNIICISLGLLFSKDVDNKIDISIKGELLSYVFIIPTNGMMLLIMVASRKLLYYNLFTNSACLSICWIIFFESLIIILTILFIKCFVVILVKKFRFL